MRECDIVSIRSLLSTKGALFRWAWGTCRLEPRTTPPLYPGGGFFLRPSLPAGYNQQHGVLAMFRFTIRDVLWLTVVVALLVGWWVEHRQSAARDSEWQNCFQSALERLA